MAQAMCAVEGRNGHLTSGRHQPLWLRCILAATEAWR